MKKNVILISIIASTIVLATISILIALRVRQLGTRPVAPSVPESRPKAEENIPDITPLPGCKKTFTPLSPTLTPTGGPSSTPTLTPTPTPTSTPGPTVTPGGPSLTPTSTPTSTPNPSSTPRPTNTLVPTSTPKPTSTLVPTSTPKPTKAAVQPSPTEAVLPPAGIKIPTLGGILIGFFLISLGVVLVF